MLDLNSSTARIAASAVGVALHAFVFHHGEWDNTTTKLLCIFVGSQALGAAGLVHYYPADYDSVTSAISTVAWLAFYVVLGLTSSILVYRGFFHRLNRFPGPFAARLSNLYPTVLSAKKLHLYEEVQSLHRQYGDYVRLGPSELSINDPKAVAAIHSANSGCVKGPWYNVLHPMVSLQMIRNKPDHIRRRKVWDRGFSAKALREYEPRVVKYTDQLLSYLEKTAGTPVNVTDWFNFYSFDVMGDLAWGKSFGMLKDGVKHYFMKCLHADMGNIGLFSHMMWLFPIFKETPILNAAHKKFFKWTDAQVQERKSMEPDRPDVFSWLLEDYRAHGTPTAQDDLNLLGDAYLIAVAGSDTTAAVLTCLFFQLALDPRCLRALQTEVDTLFESGAEVDAAALVKMPYLESVIHESMRLHPPVPSGVQRMTPPEGLQIGEVHIPGDTIVQIPTHTMFRDERVFASPNDFIPERWTTRKELTIDPTVFIPFSVGRYSCIGKQLGLMEIRHVTAQIVRRYDVAFASGQTAQAFLDGKTDTFTLALGNLELVLSPRKK